MQDALFVADTMIGGEAIATTAPDLPPKAGVHATFARDYECKRRRAVIDIKQLLVLPQRTQKSANHNWRCMAKIVIARSVAPKQSSSIEASWIASRFAMARGRSTICGAVTNVEAVDSEEWRRDTLPRMFWLLRH